LPAALTVAHLQVNLLALLHVSPPGPLEHGRVQEHVLPAVFRGDEAEAAHLVEPLDRAGQVVGRAARVAVEIPPGRGPVAELPWSAAEAAATAEIPARWSAITDASTAAAETTATAEIPTGRTVAETAATTEIAARGTITEAAATAEIPARWSAITEASTAAAETTATAEIPTGRTVAETAATTEIAARGTITEAAATAEIPTGGTITEAAATAERATRSTAAGSAAFAALQLCDAGDEAPALPVRTDLADEGVAGVRGLDARLGQGGSVEEHVLAVRAEHEAEALSGVVPLDLGLDRPVSALIFEIRRHLLEPVSL
jgi:hypothetical protein